MANPRIADAVGLVDGLNKDFTTPTDFTPGTLEVFRNGVLLRRQDDDGWIETGVNAFQLKEAPIPLELIRVFYTDTLPVGPGPQIEALVATLVETDVLFGTVDSTDALTGTLIDLAMLSGTIDDVEILAGELTDSDALVGVLVDC